MTVSRTAAFLTCLLAGLLFWVPLFAVAPPACAAGEGRIDSFIEQNRKAFEKDLEKVEQTYGENCGEDGEGVEEDKEVADANGKKPNPPPRPQPKPGPGAGPGQGGPGRDFGNDDYVVEKVWIELVSSRSADGSTDPFDNDDVEKLFKNGRVVAILTPGGTPTVPTGGGAACVPPTSTGPSATFPAAAISNDLSGCQTATNSIAAGAIAGSSEVLVIAQSPVAGIRISFINNGPFIFSNATGATPVGGNQFDAADGATVTFHFDHTVSGGTASLTFTVRIAGGGNVTIENASLAVT